jgi:small subunit ribosomal protein S1
MADQQETQQAAETANNAGVATLEDITLEDVMGMEDMESLYESSMANFKEGEVVRGSVVGRTEDHVLVDIGYKSEGVVTVDEFPDPDDIKVGDSFDFYIEEPEDEDGMPFFRRSRRTRSRIGQTCPEVYEQRRRHRRPYHAASRAA